MSLSNAFLSIRGVAECAPPSRSPSADHRFSMFGGRTRNTGYSSHRLAIDPTRRYASYYLSVIHVSSFNVKGRSPYPRDLYLASYDFYR